MNVFCELNGEILLEKNGKGFFENLVLVFVINL